MNCSYYKYCIVPQCKNTSIKTPNKLFIYVPNNQQIRKKWLTLARRDDAHCLSTNTRMYFCEDHFDLRNDMLNYTEYHIMGRVSQVRMKPGCTPSKFGCQEDSRKRTCSSTERSYILKKQRMTTTAECPNEPEKSCMPSSPIKDTPHTCSGVLRPTQAAMTSATTGPIGFTRETGDLPEECVDTADILLFLTSSSRATAASVSRSKRKCIDHML